VQHRAKLGFSTTSRSEPAYQGASNLEGKKEGGGKEIHSRKKGFRPTWHYTRGKGKRQAAVTDRWVSITLRDSSLESDKNLLNEKIALGQKVSGPNQGTATPSR